MYHRVARESFDPWGLAVAPEKFGQQLSWLAAHRSPLSLAEFARLHRGRALPDDAVAVTFDDGYACTANLAVPLLYQHGIPATIFLPAGLIGQSRPFWWDELSEIVMTFEGSSLRTRGRTFEIGQPHAKDATWPRDNRKRTARQRAFYELWSRLQSLPPEEIKQALAELRAQAMASPDLSSRRLMTEDEVRGIASQSIEIGSHAMTHASLPGLPAPQKSSEIRESLSACESLAATRPLTFAYPFGDFDPECERLVEDAGFICACTVEPRVVRADDNLYALPRLKAGNWTAGQLKHALAAAAYEQARTQA